MKEGINEIKDFQGSYTIVIRQFMNSVTFVDQSECLDKIRNVI